MPHGWKDVSKGDLCLAQQACLPLWRLQGNPRGLPAWPHHLGTCPVPGISASDSAGIGFGWCGRWGSSAGGCRSRPHGTAGSGGRNPGEGRQRPQLPISANPSSVPRASSPGSDPSIPRPHDRSIFSPPFLSRINDLPHSHVPRLRRGPPESGTASAAPQLPQETDPVSEQMPQKENKAHITPSVHLGRETARECACLCMLTLHPSQVITP